MKPLIKGKTAWGQREDGWHGVLGRKRNAASHWEDGNPAGVHARLPEPSLIHYSLADISRAVGDTICVLSLKAAKDNGTRY